MDHDFKPLDSSFWNTFLNLSNPSLSLALFPRQRVNWTTAITVERWRLRLKQMSSLLMPPICYTWWTYHLMGSWPWGMPQNEHCTARPVLRLDVQPPLESYNCIILIIVLYIIDSFGLPTFYLLPFISDNHYGSMSWTKWRSIIPACANMPWFFWYSNSSHLGASWYHCHRWPAQLRKEGHWWHSKDCQSS